MNSSGVVPKQQNDKATRPFACLNCGKPQDLPPITGTFTCVMCQAAEGSGKIFETRRTAPTWHSTR